MGRIGQFLIEFDRSETSGHLSQFAGQVLDYFEAEITTGGAGSTLVSGS